MLDKIQEMNDIQKKQKKTINRKFIEDYIRYSSLAIQMGVVIFIFVYIGKYIDKKLLEGKLIFTLIFSIFGVFVGLYLALKDFIIKKNK